MDKYILLNLFRFCLIFFVFFIYLLTLLLFSSKKEYKLFFLIIIAIIFIFNMLSYYLFDNHWKLTIILFLIFIFILGGIYFYRDIEKIFFFLKEVFGIFGFSFVRTDQKIIDLKSIGTALIVAGLVFLGQFFIELFS